MNDLITTTHLRSIADTMNTRFSSLEASITAPAASTATAFTIQSGSATQAAAALSVLQPHLAALLQGGIPVTQHGWVEQDFRRLLSAVYKQGAQELGGGEISHLPKGKTRPTQSFGVQARYNASTQGASGALCPRNNAGTLLQTRTDWRHEEVEVVQVLPIGRMTLYVERSSSTGAQIQEGCRILFIPKAELGISGAAAAYVRTVSWGSPNILPSLSTFNVVSWNAPILMAVEAGDLIEARKLLVEGKGSPSDRNEWGNSLLDVSLTTFELKEVGN